MKYSKTIMLQSCHFNYGETYEAHKNNIMKETISTKEYMRVLEDIHGHDFKIVVDITKEEYSTGLNYMVDDVVINDIVQEWNNKNLSVHEDFVSHGCRATTENMALLLKCKLERKINNCKIKVTVHETRDMYASV